MAAWWLEGRGLRVVARNVSVRGGEIDLLARDGNQLVAVEVRTVTRLGDPIDAVDGAKRRHVARIAAAAGASRVDMVGVGLDRSGVVVHWVPG